MAQMSSTTWLNQKITNVLGDFKNEREPEEDPSPCRAICRVIFMVFLVVGFSLLLAYYLLDSPDVRVKQIHHVKPGGKNHRLVTDFLYSKPNASNNAIQYSRRPINIVCPCSNTSIVWRDFMSFYAMSENSTEWNLSVYAGNATTMPYIYVPGLSEVNIGLLSSHINKDKAPLTSQKFCEMSTLWPNATADDISYICHWLASALFPGVDEFQDSRRSNQILETPFLMNREIFNMRIAERARDSILMRRLRIDMINEISYTLKKYYNGMASFLTNILDRDESEEWESYYYGALFLNSSLESNSYYMAKNPMIFALVNTTSEPARQIFLHPEYNWTKYYETCNPEYCEETKEMTALRKLTNALGLVGGVITLVLGIVSVLLWPATGYLLLRCFDKSPASDENKEQPQASLLMSRTVGSKMRLSHEPEV